MPSLSAIVLGAGRGTRMKSARPKVLHPVCGRPLIEYSVAAAFAVGAEQVVVVTSGQPEIQAALEARFGRERLSVAVQEPARGTGDAVRVGLGQVRGERVLVLCGDTPLVTENELRELGRALEPDDVKLAFLSAELEAPGNYGRVLRSAAGEVREIREAKDCRSEEERAVREVNAGMYAARTSDLAGAVARLTPNNAQGEYYLTDVVALLAESGRVLSVKGPADALVGVNDRADLAQAEEVQFARQRELHRRAGVTVHGDARIDVGVAIGVDAEIGAGVALRGRTRIGARTSIDVGCVLTDSDVGDDARLKPYSVLDQSRVGDAAQIGPFAHLRAESDIEAEAHIGNFVETKKTRVRRGAKANHLAYLGDGDVGERANIGAGTIFCNYDGFSKHRTTVGEGAFIGSDSQLIAPVTIGAFAYVATGTSVTEDVPADGLAIGRNRQQNKPGYAGKLRARLQAAHAAARANAKK